MPPSPCVGLDLTVHPVLGGAHGAELVAALDPRQRCLSVAGPKPPPLPPLPVLPGNPGGNPPPDD
jgi:hypothetical protein